jgi:hypothetical protein
MTKEEVQIGTVDSVDLIAINLMVTSPESLVVEANQALGKMTSYTSVHLRHEMAESATETNASLRLNNS